MSTSHQPEHLTTRTPLFSGIGSLQRSTPRWVDANLVNKAENFVESLD